MDYIINLQINSTLGFPLYWMPLMTCAIGYIIRTSRNIVRDKSERERIGAYYTPTDTLGTLIGRGVVSVVPVANLCAAVFDVSPELFSGLIERLERIFCTPLVSDDDSFKAKRHPMKDKI